MDSIANNGHLDSRQTAEHLKNSGDEGIPIPHGKKGPGGARLKNWQKRTFGPEDFRDGDGIGVRNTTLKTIDRDCPEALALVNRFTPSTLRSGRASTPEAHSWYRTEGEAQHLEFRDVDGKMILELRSGKGHQTLIPPTINPEHNEPYVWHKPASKIATVPAKELEWGARLEAAAALIARHYPPEGGQYHFGLYLAGFLIFHGMDEETAYELMCAAYEAAGYYIDREVEKNIRGVCKSTAARDEEGEEYAGGPRLEEEYPEFPLKKLRKFLGFSKSDPIKKKGDRAPGGAQKEDKRNQADRLIQYALDTRARLFTDQFGMGHVLVNREALALNSRCYNWLRSLMWEEEGRSVNGEALKTAAGTLGAFAVKSGDCEHLHTRAAFHNGAVYYELRKGRVVEIDSEGWRFVNDPPVLFRSVPNLKELPDPQRGGSLDALDALVNLKEDHDKRMFRAALVTAPLPHIPRPIIQPTGVMGSGKTTLSRAYKRALDPTNPESMRVDPRDFIQKASHSYIVMLDNQNSIPEWGLDVVCRLVTGEGDSKRKHYTDDEDIIYELKRAVVVNGINPPADRPDYQDRTLPLELERIPDRRRRGEEELWEDFEDAHAGILGVLFDKLSEALKHKQTIKLATRPRLADWGEYAAAAYKAFGWTPELFTADWSRVARAQNESAIEGSPVAQCIISIMKEHDTFTKSPSDMLEVLETEAAKLKINTKREKTWPSAPSWVWRRIKELKITLSAVGIEATQDTRGDTRKITFTRGASPPPDPDSTDSKTGNADGNADGKKSADSAETVSTVSNDSKYGVFSGSLTFENNGVKKRKKRRRKATVRKVSRNADGADVLTGDSEDGEKEGDKETRPFDPDWERVVALQPRLLKMEASLERFARRLSEAKRGIIEAWEEEHGADMDAATRERLEAHLHNSLSSGASTVRRDTEEIIERWCSVRPELGSAESQEAIWGRLNQIIPSGYMGSIA
jgi:hypothetical protein